MGDLTIAHELPASVLLRSVAGGRAYLRSTSTSRPVTAKRMRAHSTPSLGITPLPSPRPCCATPRSPWPRSPDAWGSCPLYRHLPGRAPPPWQSSPAEHRHADQARAPLLLSDRLAAGQPLGPLRARQGALRGLRATTWPGGAAIWATVAGGTKCSRPGAMAVAARSLALPRPRSSRAERPRSCWRQPISTTTLAHCGRRHRNVKALCQRCHLLHDRPEHRRRIRITLRRRRALGDLFLGPYPSW